MTNRSKLKVADTDLMILTSPEWQDYTLLDSGNGKKLEQVGKYRLVRPEPEAIWKPALSTKNWNNSDAQFETDSKLHKGGWKRTEILPSRWNINYKHLRFWIELSASRHIGVFPEQADHWDWVESVVRITARPVRVLNLFGYTGLASLAAASGGAHVTHVDSSNRAINIAKENQSLSNLNTRPIRWIRDDVLKFISREARRNNKYDGILLDPPKFGRGPNGEVWEFYKFIANLLELVQQVLSDRPLFIILTAYGIKASSITLQNLVSDMMAAWIGRTSAGELIIDEKSAGRRLSTAIFARWQSSEIQEIL